ncbi:MAG: glycosyltransferase [Flavobacteriaceae bacterium]|nr:glycosyltransferase [Flavobacteriaceae bacterium]
MIKKKYVTSKHLTSNNQKNVNKSEQKFEPELFLKKGRNRKDEGGLRTKGSFKRSYDDKPLISIVTVVFNGEEYLEKTIKSVINQSYDNVEYIIIDGSSTDGTLDIIKKYEDQIDYWVSEKDNGVYDGMNKGIDLASGKWINFMNAGDTFYDTQTIAEIFKNNLEHIDIIYGDRQVVYANNKTKTVKALDLNLMWKGKPMCHQSCFIDSLYHKKNKFILKYDICDDFKFIYDAYREQASFYYIDQVIAKYLIGGLSGDNTLGATIEDWFIVDKSMKTNLYYFWKIFIIILKKPIRYVLKYNVSSEERNKLQNTLALTIEKFKEIR